jgi:transcriptional regulator with XRE-family HTH domain
MATVKIGQKIRRLRGHQPYAELADDLQVSESALRQIEAGTIASPKSDLLLNIARYFRVPMEWLADEQLDWPPPQSERQRIAEIVESALTRAGVYGEMTDDETLLLTAFRRLDAATQQRVLGIVVGLEMALREDPSVEVDKPSRMKKAQ